MRTVSKFLKGSRGTVAIEFAFIAPVLFAMIFGLVEYGRFLWIQNTMLHGVEDAARFAVFDLRTTANQSATAVNTVAYAKQHMYAMSGYSGIKPVVTYPVGANGTNLILVTATYPFNPLISGLTDAVNMTITVQSAVPH